MAMTHVRSMPALLRRISSSAVLRGGAGTPLEAGKPPSEPVRAQRTEAIQEERGRKANGEPRTTVFQALFACDGRFGRRAAGRTASPTVSDLDSCVDVSTMGPRAASCVHLAASGRGRTGVGRRDSASRTLLGRVDHTIHTGRVVGHAFGSTWSFGRGVWACVVVGHAVALSSHTQAISVQQPRERIRWIHQPSLVQTHPSVNETC